MRYKFLPHTADVKINAYGKTIEGAFVNSALALRSAIAGEAKTKSSIKKVVKANAKDLDGLLYRFIEEFLYLFDAKDFILTKITKLKIAHDKNGFSLHAAAEGDKASNHRFHNDVKAITYNDMFVKKTTHNFIIQFVLDV